MSYQVHFQYIEPMAVNVADDVVDEVFVSNEGFSREWATKREAWSFVQTLCRRCDERGVVLVFCEVADHASERIAWSQGIPCEFCGPEMFWMVDAEHPYSHPAYGHGDWHEVVDEAHASYRTVEGWTVVIR